MIGIKRRSSIYYPIKEYYKRRIMVGDNLCNKIVYSDLPDNYYEYSDIGQFETRNIFTYIYTAEAGEIEEISIREYINDPSYTIDSSGSYNKMWIYNWNLYDEDPNNINNKKLIFNSKCSNVTEVTDCQAYRHIYIKDPKIRPLKIGDALKNGTKLYFNIPDNITKLYSEYKYTSSTRSKVRSKTPILKATPSEPSTTDTLINNFLKVTYYPDGTVRRASVTNLILTNGSSNIDIFKATYNQSNFHKPEINISTYTVTNTTVISNYNEFDFWSQFIFVDETTL